MQPSEFGFEQKQEHTGYDLFRYSQALAWQCKQRFSWQPLLPSGARIFYYTRRLLLAYGVLPAVHPDEAMLPAPVVERFFQAAPIISERLALEFAHAVRLRAEPGTELRRLLCAPIAPDSELSSIAALLVRSQGGIQQPYEQLWETCWGAVNLEHLVRLCTMLFPARLSVAPVARPEDPPQAALRLLRDRLAQDAARGWLAPSFGAYLYDEPLEAWLLHSLFIGRWPARLTPPITKIV